MPDSWLQRANAAWILGCQTLGLPYNPFMRAKRSDGPPHGKSGWLMYVPSGTKLYVTVVGLPAGVPAGSVAVLPQRLLYAKKLRTSAGGSLRVSQKSSEEGS